MEVLGEWREMAKKASSGRVVNKLLVNEVKIFVNHKRRRRQLYLLLLFFAFCLSASWWKKRLGYLSAGTCGRVDWDENAKKYDIAGQYSVFRYRNGINEKWRTCVGRWCSALWSEVIGADWGHLVSCFGRNLKEFLTFCILLDGNITGILSNFDQNGWPSVPDHFSSQCIRRL